MSIKPCVINVGKELKTMKKIKYNQYTWKEKNRLCELLWDIFDNLPHILFPNEEDEEYIKSRIPEIEALIKELNANHS